MRTSIVDMVGHSNDYLQRQSTTEIQSSDRERMEQPWTRSEENILNDICRECVIASEQHSRSEHRCKRRYLCMSIPSVLIPILLEAANSLVGETFATYAFPIGMGAVATLNGLMTILAYAQRKERHSSTVHSYRQMADDIAILLNTPRRYRPPADTMLESYRLKFSHINAMAPDTPGSSKSYANVIRLPKTLRRTEAVPQSIEEELHDQVSIDIPLNNKS